MPAVRLDYRGGTGRVSLRVTPAMAAGITSSAWTTEELLNEGMLLQGDNHGNDRNSDSND